MKVLHTSLTFGNFTFKTSDNESNLHVFSGLKNLSGLAESIESSYSIGTRGTRKAKLQYNVPLAHYLQVDNLVLPYSVGEFSKGKF